MSDRLEAARAHVARKPTDRFGLYALAMELRKLRDWSACFAAFDNLLQVHPDYGAGYYHYAMARKESGDRAGCIEVLERGLEACRRSRDGHTASEIESALEEIRDG